MSNLNYLAGLFDAEGSAYKREKLREACCKLNSKQEAEITVAPPLQLQLF